MKKRFVLPEGIIYSDEVITVCNHSVNSEEFQDAVRKLTDDDLKMIYEMFLQSDCPVKKKLKLLKQEIGARKKNSYKWSDEEISDWNNTIALFKRKRAIV